MKDPLACVWLPCTLGHHPLSLDAGTGWHTWRENSGHFTADTSSLSHLCCAACLHTSMIAFFHCFLDMPPSWSPSLHSSTHTPETRVTCSSKTSHARWTLTHGICKKKALTFVREQGWELQRWWEKKALPQSQDLCSPLTYMYPPPEKMNGK